MAEKEVFQLYRRRWMILIAYGLLTLTIIQNWAAYGSVSNILQTFYNVTVFEVNMLMLSYDVALFLFTLPFAYILYRYELAANMKLAAVLNLIGASIRFLSTDRDGYWILILGTIPTALSYAAIAFITTKLTANWFGENETSIATSICIGMSFRL